jgi:hypothetical protein
MRKYLLLTAAACCLAVAAGRARAEDEAQAIVAKAVKAHGGLDKLAKLKKAAFQSKAKGTVHEAGGIDITMETSTQGGKFKHVVEGEVASMKFTQNLGYDGKKFWMTINGKEFKLGDQKKILAEIKEKLYAEDVAALLFFKKKGYELSPLGEVKVDGRPALGVRVSSPGHRDVNLYFDKAKGLLVKTEARSVDVMTDKEITEEKLLRDYKETDGFLIPTKVSVLHDGKKHVDLEVEEVKFVDKFEDSVFAKP